MNESIFRRKILVVILVIFFAFLVLVFRLFSVQILNNSKYTTEAAAENSFTNTMPSLRGIIESSDGSILADNTPVYDVYVSLNDVTNQSQFVNRLNSVLGESKSYLRSLFKTKLIWANKGPLG